MRALRHVLLCVLAGCGAGDRVELRFAPAEGARVRRTIGSGTLVLRTLDEYRKVGAGRPLVLRRTFEETAGPLARTSVVYTWVPEENAYGKYYDAFESSESALRDLAEDLDLRALLPAHAVALGESWSVPALDLRDPLRSAGAPGQCKLTLASVRDSLATVDVALPDARGTLVWDLRAKRAASLTLTGAYAAKWLIEDAPAQGQK